MKKEEKQIIVEDLTQKLKEYAHFYLTDISTLNAEDTAMLRRKCFEKEIRLMVVKNTLLKRAFDQSEESFSDFIETLKESTSIMFCNTGNVPAKLIKEFRKKKEKPVLKAAYVESSVYIGDNQLETLASLKSKDELVADVIALLQSPAKTVISQLQSGSNKLTGILETLEKRV